MESKTSYSAQDDPLTYQVIGEAMRVHTELGPGLDEVFYHELLVRRLTAAGLDCQSRLREALRHRGQIADHFECDALVNRAAVIELKVLAAEDTFAPEHLTQILCYLKFWKAGRGLLLDFGKESLVQRRVVFSERQIELPDADALAAQAPESVTDRPLALTILRSLTRVLAAHGLGYRDTTYRGLLAADLAAEAIPFTDQPTAPIRSSEVLLGEAKCHCGVVAGKAAVLVLALRNRISTTDRAVLQTYLKHLDLPWGIIANFGKTQFETLWVTAPRRRLAVSFPAIPLHNPWSSPNLRGQ